MNRLHKSLGFVLGIVLAAFAGSVFAASTTKTFFAVVQPVMSLTATTVSITFYNTSPPPGLSSGNSIKVIAPVVNNTQLIKFTGATSPGSQLQLGPNGSYIVINNFPGINRGQSLTFTIGVQVLATGCVAGTFGAQMNTGNSFNGDPFQPDNANMKLTSAIGCEFTGEINCGQFVETPVGGAGPDDSGYAKISVTSLDKNGVDCTGGPTLTYTIDNTLLIDNKLAVLLAGNNNAAFIAQVNSTPLPPDSNGWFSQKVKVATTKDSNGNWVFVDAQACTCNTAPLKACMPVPNQFPQLCVAAYDWVVNNLGLAVYSATIIGVGSDPAMGW